jgi:hypothetical protein
MRAALPSKALTRSCLKTVSSSGNVAISCACDPDAMRVGLSQAGSISVCGMRNSSSQSQGRKSWTRIMLTVGEVLCAVPSKFSHRKRRENCCCSSCCEAHWMRLNDFRFLHKTHCVTARSYFSDRAASLTRNAHGASPDKQVLKGDSSSFNPS